MAVILITGSSTGIGYAAAETLGRNGHTVYATMRNPQRQTVKKLSFTCKIIRKISLQKQYCLFKQPL